MSPIHIRKNQRLSLIISEDSLSCFYTDLEISEILWQQEYDASLFKKPSKRGKDVIDSLQSLNSSRIYLFDDSNRFTLVPSELYSWQSEKAALEHAVLLPISDHIYTNRAVRDLVCISEKSTFSLAIQGYFSNSFYTHLSIPLINRVLEVDSIILLYFTKNSFYVTIGEESLRFHNRFYFKNKEDVLYYLNALSTHIFKFDTITIAGSITSNSQLYHGIKSNFPNATMYSSNLIRNQLIFF